MVFHYVPCTPKNRCDGGKFAIRHCLLSLILRNIYEHGSFIYVNKPFLAIKSVLLTYRESVLLRTLKTLKTLKSFDIFKTFKPEIYIGLLKGTPISTLGVQIIHDVHG